MPHITLPGVELYFELAGTGPRLLYVGGTGSDLRRVPSPFSSPAAARTTMLAYDHRGLGRSVAADAGHQPTMADFADDALALCDALGWDDFLLIGVSFGGMVAQEIALRGSGRVRRLVLCCTSSGGVGGASAPLHEIYPRPLEERLDQMVALADMRTRHDEQRRATLRATLAAAAPAEIPIGLQRQLAARRGHDTWDRLDALACPTLIAAGRHDGIAPLANAEALAGRIPGARLAVFDGGHGFFFDDRAAWPAMLAFLLDDDPM